MLKEFHILKGSYTTSDTKTYTKIVLNMKIHIKVATDGLDNHQQVIDGNPLISGDLKL